MTQINSSGQVFDIGIAGMTCASCVARVERALKKVPGVDSVAVNLAIESAHITSADSALQEGTLRRAIRDAGYEPVAVADTAAMQPSGPWTGFAPVALGLVLSAPLVLPMVGDLLAAADVDLSDEILSPSDVVSAEESFIGSVWHRAGMVLRFACAACVLLGAMYYLLLNSEDMLITLLEWAFVLYLAGGWCYKKSAPAR